MEFETAKNDELYMKYTANIHIFISVHAVNFIMSINTLTLSGKNMYQLLKQSVIWHYLYNGLNMILAVNSVYILKHH